MSVRKRSWKTASGVDKTAWVVDYVDQSGKRHIKTFDKKKDADAYSATVRVEVRSGVHTADSQSVTVEKAGELWLKTCEQNGLERSTVDAYRQHIKFHINPYLGRVKLSQLSTALVRQFEDDLLSGNPAPGESEGKPRSQAMKRKIRSSLGSLISDAQERGLISRNVVRELRSKRRPGKEARIERRQKGKLKVGIDIPTPDEIRALITYLLTERDKKPRWTALFMTAIFAGLRASELRGLRWADVDFERSQIRVHQRADRYKEIGAPKSEAGERTIPIPPTLVNVLKQWKLACPKSKLDLAFPTGNGNVELHSNIVNRGFQPALIAAGVCVPKLDSDGKPEKDREEKPIMEPRYTGLHALRHFFASWCINRKVDGGLELPPKVVQERLGHSTIAMTMDVYGHLFPRGDDADELAAAELSLLGATQMRHELKIVK